MPARSPLGRLSPLKRAQLRSPLRPGSTARKRCRTSEAPHVRGAAESDDPRCPPGFGETALARNAESSVRLGSRVPEQGGRPPRAARFETAPGAKTTAAPVTDVAGRRARRYSGRCGHGGVPKQAADLSPGRGGRFVHGTARISYSAMPQISLSAARPRRRRARHGRPGELCGGLVMTESKKPKISSLCVRVRPRAESRWTGRSRGETELPGATAQRHTKGTSRSRFGTRDAD